MRAVGQQVVFGVPGNDLSQALAELALQKAQDFAHSLQREALASQLANDCNFGDVFHRIQPPMALPQRLEDTAFIPPLQLARRDPGKDHHLLRREVMRHLSSKMFETIRKLDVSNILGVVRSLSTTNQEQDVD